MHELQHNFLVKKKLAHLFLKFFLENMFVKNMLKINLQVGPKQCLCLASCAINTLADIRVRTWVQLWQ